MREGLLRVFSIKQGSILTIVLFLALVGCVSAEPTAESTIEETKELVTSSSELVNEVIISVTSPAENTPPPSATPTTLPTATLEPTQTATLMPTRTTAPTQTSTSTALPPFSLTPLPTIPSNQRGQLYAELMATNNGCQLPCWWGLEMGSSTFEEVVQLYTQFDPVITIQDFPENKTRVTIQFVEHNNIEGSIQTTHTFRGQNGVVLEAEIQVHKYENFTPLSLMEQFGQPSEVWLWTIPEPYQGLLPAYFRFFFPEKGILSAYAESGERVGGNVEICFNGDGGSILLLWNPDIWNPDGSKDFTERANASAELTLWENQPISEVSNWDEEELYTNLLNPGSTECLQTPSDLWTPP